MGEQGARPAAAPAQRQLCVTFAPASEPIDALRDEWRAVAPRAAEPNAFAEHWFVAASLRHLGHGQVRIAVVRDGGILIGLMPLAIERRYGRIPVRHVQNWRHHQQFLCAPLVRQGREKDFWRELLLALDQADWPHNFLHIRDLVEGGPLHKGLTAAASQLGRAAPTVFRESRAFLQTDLAPAEYYSQTVRKKKRKELARLRNRLGELGALSTRRFSRGDDLAAWCDAFLALERSGWKGREGSALACTAATERFFRDALASAEAAGKLQLIALHLDDRPIAMLVNFLAPPGSFSFKTAFDEGYARFSPGVLLQIENLAILERPEIGWMDSCAAEQHPMIESLWAERRTLARVTVPLRGARRRAVHAAARALERISAARRRPPRAVSDGASE